MNAFVQSRRFPQHTLIGVVVVVVLGMALLGAAPVQAAAHTSPVQAQTQSATVELPQATLGTPLFAAWYDQVLGDRTRMIQVATLFMIAGIVMLMWTRGK